VPRLFQPTERNFKAAAILTIFADAAAKLAVVENALEIWPKLAACFATIFRAR
jgi:hypothetical protein